MPDDNYDNENRPKYIALALLISAAFFFLANDGSAADYYMHRSEPNTIVINGDIAHNECSRFENVLAGLNYTVTDVVVSSAGGRSSQGLCMARVIRRLGIATSTNYALSAGAIVWLGGVERSLGFAGIVAIHGAYIADEAGPRTLDEIEREVNINLISKLIDELGYDPVVKDLIVSTMVGPSDEWISLHKLATHRQGEPDVLSR